MSHPKCLLGKECKIYHEWIRPAVDALGGFCSIECRETYFSRLGAGDIRGKDMLAVSLEEKRYIRQRPCP